MDSIRDDLERAYSQVEGVDPASDEEKQQKSFLVYNERRGNWANETTGEAAFLEPDSAGVLMDVMKWLDGVVDRSDGENVSVSIDELHARLRSLNYIIAWARSDGAASWHKRCASVAEQFRDMLLNAFARSDPAAELARAQGTIELPLSLREAMEKNFPITEEA